MEIEPDIEHELQAEALIATKPVKILHNEELEVPVIEAVNDKVQKVVKNKFKEPVTKKLDVNEELQRAEYVTQWAQKVMEGEYDTIFSIGSKGVVDQQLPSFSKGLGKVAILNIDYRFQSTDTHNISKFDNVSVNYLEAKLPTPERNKTVESTQREENFKEDSPTMTQEALIGDTCKLMDSGQKVILLSHISIQSPRLHFDKILSHPNILS